MIQELARPLHDVRWNALTTPAQRKLLLSTLANLSVAVAGRSAMRLPRPPAGTGHLLLDGGETGNAREAAFYNAALMHARTQDDFHPVGNLHIATVVLPAVLADAERLQASGERVLDAVATGYAAATGLSRQLSARTTPRGLRSTCLYASQGAAAAVSRLRGHSAAQIANTLSLSTQSAFGTTQCWRDGSDEYQLHAANAAGQALLCADLTDAGVVGGAHALDGPSGFFAALGVEVPAWPAMAPDFEPSAAIVDCVLKRYPVSGICQPVTRLAERLAADVRGADIRSGLIEMNPYEMNYPGTLNAGPEFRSFSDRLMSSRFCAGSVLEVGRFDFDAFIRPMTPLLARLVAATDVRGADDLGQLSCRITLTTTSGQEVRGEMRDGGKDLAIDWDTIDEWAGALWSAAGRPPGSYARARAAVEGLAGSSFGVLRGALAG